MRGGPSSGLGWLTGLGRLIGLNAGEGDIEKSNVISVQKTRM
jgi:hypothetical protein